MIMCVGTYCIGLGVLFLMEICDVIKADYSTIYNSMFFLSSIAVRERLPDFRIFFQSRVID